MDDNYGGYHELYDDPRHMRYIQIARELDRRVAALQAPEGIYDWLRTVTDKLAPPDTSKTIMDWPASFEMYDAEIERRIALSKLPESERKLFNWPWKSWNDKIDPIEPGLLAIIAGPDGSGKCLGRGTKIVMYDGTLRSVEDIKVGDVLMGPDSQPRRVLKLGQGREMMYWVRQNAGVDYRANGSHILALLRRNEDGSKTPVEMTIDEVQRLKSGYLQRYIQGYKVPVEYPEQAVPLDPYFLGLWLGDGSSYSSAIYNPDSEIIDWLRDYAAEIGFGITVISGNKRDTCQKITISNGVGKHSVNAPSRKLKDLGLIGNKHIPHQYLANSKEMRLRLLAGLLDSDGSYADKGFEITQKRKDLAYQIKYLADSLGFRTYIKAKRATIKDRGFECTVWRLTIHGDMTCVPIKVERKKPAERIINKDWRVTGIKIEPAGVDDFFGFVIDGDGLFLLEDMTVTHNTTYCENIAEYWARRGQKVAFVHFELSKIIMLDRRAVRHTAIARRQLKLAGELTKKDMYNLKVAKEKLLSWPGKITYLHTPGKSIELVLRDLAKLHAAGDCDIAVVDYLEKATSSANQLKAFGANQFQREANDVDLLKNFSEEYGVPMLLLSQFSKSGKATSFADLDRGAIRGAGEKSEKANVVVLLQPDKTTGTTINLKLDKNTLGPKGTWQQFINLPQFLIGDIA